MAVDRYGLEVLTREECLRLLGVGRVGRVGVTIGALPAVLPVNYTLARELGVLFRTTPGTKLSAALRNAVVAFEVDEVDHEARTGWSVLVTGIAREITAEDELAAMKRLPLEPWVSDGMEHYVCITIDMVSGRRLRAPENGE